MTNDVKCPSMCLFSSAQSLSYMWLCDPMDCSMPGFPVHYQLVEFTQTHVHWVSDVIRPSHPLLSPSPPAFNLSQHQGLFKWVSQFFASGSQKYWRFTFSIIPSNEHSGLISFRMDWLDLLAVSQESSPTPQFKSINLWRSAFFIVQLSHPYMTAGKTMCLLAIHRSLILIFMYYFYYWFIGA